MSGYQAVILAAGRGSRLADKTKSVPKALLPLGPRTLHDSEEVSFLRRQVELLQQAGVEQIVVVVGYRREQILAELARWGRSVQPVQNPEAECPSSGSLHSLQCAVRAGLGVLDGSRQTLYLDADIVYHRRVLPLLLEAPAETAMLVCARRKQDDEEVLVYGRAEQPRFVGKGLGPLVAGGEPCFGEAVGIVKLAPDDHQLARATMDWMLGDPDAPAGSLRARGFGPARRATEHEELAQHLMHLGRMRCVVFDEELPFMEVDSAEEYELARESFYPRLLRIEEEER
jgi:choline kinase